MFKKLLTTRSLCVSAVIAALYAALTALLAPLSYGSIQCRVAEALTLLPMLLPPAIPGLFVGCLIANLFSPMVTLWDILFGSLATLLAAAGTYRLRRWPLLAAACPVLVNGLILGAVLSVTARLPYGLTAFQVALGEAGAVIIGLVLMNGLKRAKVDLSRFL